MRMFKAFLQDQRGSYTIEFCLWIPVFLFFLAATIDASVIYLTHNAMWNAARDTARRVTTGQLSTELIAEGYLINALTVYRDEMHPPVVVFEGQPDVTVTLSANIGEISPFGIFGWVDWWYGYQEDVAEEDSINNRDLVAQVTMRREPNLI